MGYTTTFDGAIRVTPPMPPELVEKFNDFCGERHEDYSQYPSIWCDWKAAADGTYISWNGSEKSYEMDHWLEYLVFNFFAPDGYNLEGEMMAHGEEAGDIWMLRVTDNEVERVNAKITF